MIHHKEFYSIRRHSMEKMSLDRLSDRNQEKAFLSNSRSILRLRKSARENVSFSGMLQSSRHCPR